MKRRRIAGVGFVAGLVVLGAGFLAASQVAAADAVVSIGSTTAAPGSQVTVILQASNIPDTGLGAYSVDITYDQSVVSTVDCTSDIGLCNPTFTEDTVRFAGASVNSELVGDVTLGSITFTCDSEGTTGLTVDVRELVDQTPGAPPEADIPSTPQNGRISCTTQVAGTGAVVQVGDGSAAVGQRDTVSLDALNVPAPGLGAWTLDVSYDNTKIHAVSCEPAQAGLGVCNPQFDDNTVRVTGANIDGLEGDNALSDLTFQCDAAGTSDLTITVQVLADATLGSPQPIDASTVDGSFTCRTAAAPSPTPTPTTPVVVVSAGSGGGFGWDGGNPMNWLIAGLAGAGIAWLLSGAASAGWATVTSSGSAPAPERAPEPPAEDLASDNPRPKSIPVMRRPVTRLPDMPPLVEPDAFHGKGR